MSAALPDTESVAESVERILEFLDGGLD